MVHEKQAMLRAHPQVSGNGEVSRMNGPWTTGPSQRSGAERTGIAKRGILIEQKRGNLRAFFWGGHSAPVILPAFLKTIALPLMGTVDFTLLTFPFPPHLFVS